MIQKHVYIKNLQGTVSLNKDVLVDLAELVRISPLSSRLLFFIMGYADDNNEIILFSRISIENNIDNLIKRLLGLSPKETLKRGYAIISDKNGNTIKDKEDIKQGEDIDIIWANSKITIKNVNKED